MSIAPPTATIAPRGLQGVVVAETAVSDVRGAEAGGFGERGVVDRERAAPHVPP